MRNRYNILFSLFWASLVLVGIETQAQENLKFAPNDIPVPWYSQKITGCPYTHCSLASSLMVFDYFKGMTADAQRTSSDAEKKLIEYQRNYFFKKRAPFRRRTSIGQGGYYSFEIDSLTRYYENMISAEHFQQKDYRILKDYIDRGIPVLINVRYTGATRGLRPGPRGHWIVLRGIDDKYAFEGDNISKDMTDLLCNIIFNPKLDGNSFCEEEITQEKRQLKEVIDSEFNDKRTYSINQAVKIICKYEPYSLSRFGTKEDIDTVTGEDLYNGWVSLLNNSRVEIFYVGDSSSDAVIDELKAQFSKYDRTECEINNIVSGEVTEVKTVKEEMELSQSKMILAFRTDISDNKDNTMPMRLAVAMLGGTAHSKLFNNVREKLSLCYYCSSRFIKNKGLMFIESGVEKKNIEEAKNAILKELDDLANGNFTDFEINATKLSMCNSFITIADNEFGLETWYFSQVLSNKISSVEDACKEVNSVTREEIIEMAKKLKLDTVYTLESKE